VNLTSLDSVNGAGVVTGHVLGIEIIDLTGAAAGSVGGPTGANTVTLNAADVLETGGHTITILGDGNDVVNLSGAGGTAVFSAGTTVGAPTGFTAYTATAPVTGTPLVTVLVENTITA